MDSEIFVFLFVGLYGMLILGGVIALIYLIIRRIEDKRDETFEKRDN